MKYEVAEIKDLNIEVKDGAAIVTINGKQIALEEGENLSLAFVKTAPESTKPAEDAPVVTEKAAEPAQRSSFGEDFAAALKISLTNFRGSKYIFKSLKNTWYDRELQSAIKMMGGIVSYFVLVLGAATVMLLGSKYFETPVTAALTIIFVLIDIIVINPMLIYISAPKPIRSHIKMIDKMNEAERALYDEEKNRLNVSRTVQRIVDRHDENGNMIYRDRD